MRFLLTTAALFLGLAPAASAVTVVAGDADPVVVNLADVPHDAGSGVSLDALLTHLRIDPYGFKSFEVSAAGGGEVALSREEAIRTGEPPVFYEDGSGTHFDPRAGGDVLSGDLTLRLAKEIELEVQMTVSEKRTEPGELVTFEAEPVSAPPGEEVTYKWNFDDGKRASGARVRHRFKEPGSYDVIVGMTTASNKTGDDDIVTVRVGKETGGPDRKGGGTNDDANAPDSGAATGGSGGSGSGAGDGGSPATDSEASTPAPASETEPAPKLEPKPEPSTPANAVEGVLLSSSTPPVPQPARQAARTGTPRDDAREKPVPEWVWAVLTVAVLLGAGLVADRGRFARINWGTPSA